MLSPQSLNLPLMLLLNPLKSPIKIISQLLLHHLNILPSTLQSRRHQRLLQCQLMLLIHFLNLSPMSLLNILYLPLILVYHLSLCPLHQSLTILTSSINTTLPPTLNLLIIPLQSSILLLQRYNLISQLRPQYLNLRIHLPFSLQPL